MSSSIDPKHLEDLERTIQTLLEQQLPRIEPVQGREGDAKLAKQRFERAKAILRAAKMLLPWDTGFNATNDLGRSCRALLNVCSNIGEIHHANGLSGRLYVEPLNRLLEESSRVCESAIEALSDALHQPNGIRWLELPGFSDIAKLKEDLVALRTGLQTQIEVAKVLNDELKRDVRAKAIGDQEDRFQTAAESARRVSQVWIAGIWMAAIFLLLYTGFHFDGIKELTQIVPRAMVATVAFSIMYWSFRNYAAAKHNQTVNEHRANSLATMRQFLLTEEAPDTRKEILSQALLSAFGQQPSGFIGGETAPDMSRIINNLQSGPTKS